MLVLTRKVKPLADQPNAKDESGIKLVNTSDEPVTIVLQPGESLGSIHIVRLSGSQVRLGLDLPREITVVRAELPVNVKQPQGVPAG